MNSISKIILDWDRINYKKDADLTMAKNVVQQLRMISTKGYYVKPEETFLHTHTHTHTER